MNIFVLDLDTKKAAEYHNNRHVVKMILEYTQLLSTAYYSKDKTLNISLHDFPRKEGFYRPTHWNHPCTVWARTSLSNWKWLLSLALNLCDEYKNRYKKIHSCESILNWMLYNIPKIPDVKMTEFKQAMPNYLHSNNPVKSYRNYYMLEKKHIAQWKNKIPYWYNLEKGKENEICL